MSSPRLWVVVASVIAGCAALGDEEKTDVADGQPCAASSECRSHICAAGYCGGSSCDTNDPTSCAPGWRCTTFEGGFLSSGSVECVALCGACPPNAHCPLGGEDGTTACTDGPTRKVTITGPSRAKIGSDVTFSATVDPPFPEVLRVEWMVGPAPGKGESFGPSTPTVTTKLDLATEGDFVVSAVVHGRIQGNDFEEAGGSLPIRHDCLAEGDVCDADGEGYEHRQLCCGAGLYCPGQVNGKGPYYCAPARN